MTIEINGKNESFFLRDFFKKLDVSGKAKCMLCVKEINYGSKGVTALIEHATKAKRHVEKCAQKCKNYSVMDMGILPASSSTSSSSVTTAQQVYGIHPSLVKQGVRHEQKQSLVPMCDRISNAEVNII